ncbi:MAG: NADPH:quinone oxidoreductase family protein [Defluviimonas sp.]|uniref:NADPH:quinone oxidoreductase family protein n=1 Tax=Albidovulum sp. TaxID=1872424 RepID=UPI001D85CC99|nr:NADPH:quinone oxidoreductase family protein [Paracoccaceae bacterium]MCC0064618.1 NADPH:quinone oxidoreductase family protein [Defluviimonas sp.]
MKAFGIRRIGAGAERIDLPDRAPGPGELRVKLAACGLNFADLLLAEGRYQERPDPPFALGLEAAGTVESLGPGVIGPAPGTRVAVFTSGGGLAEYGTFAAERCVTVPDAMPFEEAAAFQIAYGTSHVALETRARLQPGETLLVLGAAGGVGLTAVEIGKRMGARVIACARGPDKLAAAAAAGADHLVDSATADLKAEVRALGGADVVYDPVGGDLFEAAFRATNAGGRILPIGFASGQVPQIPANHLLVKNISVLGLYWGGYLKFRPEVLTDSLKVLLGWYEAGGLRPHISHVLPFGRAAEALELLRRRQSTGKVVVTL